MKYLAYLIALILILALDFGILAPVGLGWAVPSILLLMVLCIGMEYGSLDFFFFAVLGGLWMDIYFGLPIGSFLGAYVLVGLAGYIVFQRLLLSESNWKYYFVFAFAAELFLLLWLWAYTNVLLHLHWAVIGLSGRQLVHYSPALFISALVCAFPVYGLVNLVVRRSRKWLRQPLRLS